MKHENVVLFDNAGLPSVMVKFTPFDTASGLCRSKDPGWHLMTNAEWEYLHNESIEGGRFRTATLTGAAITLTSRRAAKNTITDTR